MKTKKFWIPVLLVVLIAIGSGAWFYQKYLEKKEEPYDRPEQRRRFFHNHAGHDPG